MEVGSSWFLQMISTDQITHFHIPEDHSLDDQLCLKHNAEVTWIYERGKAEGCSTYIQELHKLYHFQ